MLVPLELKCLACSRIFCCPKCRRKHELVQHDMSFECGICRGRPLVVDQESLSGDKEKLMEHVMSEHMPLHCVKCESLYENPEDLQLGLGVCKGKFQKKMLSHLKHVEKSPVMTSTPTNPLAAKWHKCLASSTLSGIHSIDSDATQSPPIDEQKVTSTNHTYSMESSQEAIACKNSNLEVCDSSCAANSDAENTSTKKKRVTFADDVDENKKIPTRFAEEHANSPSKTPPSASKRKRTDSLINESPLGNKRYKFSGRISCRRPINRVLKGGVVLPERSYSTDEYFRKIEDDDVDNDNNNSPFNKSF